MLIWGAAIIPFLTVLIMAWAYSKKLVWWEYLATLVLPILIIWGIKSGCESAQVRCTEYWGSYLTHAEYHEHWNEYIHRTCYQCTSHNKDGMCTGGYFYDCSYVEDHPAYWNVWNKENDAWPVSQDDFEKLCQMWGSRNFIKLKQPCYTICGDMYETNLPVSYLDNQLIITTTSHSYENRIQASHSIFNYRYISKKDADAQGLYTHPLISGWYQPVILGDFGPSWTKNSLEKVNGMLGSPSKARFFVLIFKNKPIEISYDQEAYWKGANKNEIAICIGTGDNYSVNWVRPFGWSKQEELKLNIRDYLMSQKVLNLDDFGKWLYPLVQGKIIRRDFKEFKYLTVDPPTWATVLVYLLMLGICLWSVYFWVGIDLGEQGQY